MARNNWSTIEIFKERIETLYSCMENLYYTQEQFIAQRREMILDNERYKKLPLWAKRYLNGWEDCKHSYFWKNTVVFCYPNYEGKMLPINGEEYREFREKYGHGDETINRNGHYCYVKDTSKIYF